MVLKSVKIWKSSSVQPALGFIKNVLISVSKNESLMRLKQHESKEMNTEFCVNYPFK